MQPGFIHTIVESPWPRPFQRKSFERAALVFRAIEHSSRSPFYWHGFRAESVIQIVILFAAQVESLLNVVPPIRRNAYPNCLSNNLHSSLFGKTVAGSIALNLIPPVQNEALVWCCPKNFSIIIINSSNDHCDYNKPKSH